MNEEVEQIEQQGHRGTSKELESRKGTSTLLCHGPRRNENEKIARCAPM